MFLTKVKYYFMPLLTDHDSSLPFHCVSLYNANISTLLSFSAADGSILNEAILDTNTWTWIRNCELTCGADGENSRPTGRHGHSVVLDDTRNRLVLFGGGSGVDLLRSGEDNSEVWELQLGDNWHQHNKFEESFPWKWKKLHYDSEEATDTTAFCNRDRQQKNQGKYCHVDSTKFASRLSPSEMLCLGRCHHGIKISRDTVLLFFGSGRPSTNGVIAYDLRTDTFFRQQQVSRQITSSSTSSGGVHIKGTFPKPRFTGVAAFLEEDGYIITHGGYCSQDHDTIGTMDVLDLCPTFRGRLGCPSSFRGLAVDARRVSYEQVTDKQAEQSRQNRSQMYRGELPFDDHSL
mmetsp:Transcript_14193/g.39675  ORF Transcript_14193/g.39675 Transcript_14193/m.39675 type:complete len:347 (+) Transcript_14193:658-1698(+)